MGSRRLRGWEQPAPARNLSPQKDRRAVQISEESPYEVRRKARAVNEEFRNVFTDLPGSNDLSVHRIRLTSDRPVKSKPYAIPFHIKPELENDIRDDENNIIRVSKLPYASPVVLVRKRDGTNQLCMDYSKLNRLTTYDPELTTL